MLLIKIFPNIEMTLRSGILALYLLTIFYWENKLGYRLIHECVYERIAAIAVARFGSRCCSNFFISSLNDICGIMTLLKSHHHYR